MSEVGKEFGIKLRCELAGRMDKRLRESEFSRRANSLIYTRKFKSAKQKLDVGLSLSPPERPKCAGVIYPFCEINIEEVNRLVSKMAANGESVNRAHLDVTLRQPLDWLSPKSITARWYCSSMKELPGTVDLFDRFVATYALPFYEFYCDPSAIVSAYESHDNRVINDLRYLLYVAASMVILGDPSRALALMETHYGKPAIKKKHKAVFTYLHSLLK